MRLRLDKYENVQGIDLSGFWIIEPDDNDSELKIKLKNFM